MPQVPTVTRGESLEFEQNVQSLLRLVTVIPGATATPRLPSVRMTLSSTCDSSRRPIAARTRTFCCRAGVPLTDCVLTNVSNGFAVIQSLFS